MISRKICYRWICDNPDGVPRVPPPSGFSAQLIESATPELHLESSTIRSVPGGLLLPEARDYGPGGGTGSDRDTGFNQPDSGENNDNFSGDKRYDQNGIKVS